MKNKVIFLKFSTNFSQNTENINKLLIDGVKLNLIFVESENYIKYFKNMDLSNIETYIFPPDNKILYYIGLYKNFQNLLLNSHNLS